MKPLPIVVLLAALIAAPIVPQQEDPVRLIGGGKAVELALDGVSVADFLVRAQTLLGVPIHSLPDEVVPARLHQAGEQRVEIAAFRDEFDAVLRRAGFWAWDDTSGGAPAIVVRRAPAGRYLGQVPFTPPVITLEELVAGPSRRGPMYTTTFALTHVPARNCLVILMPFLDIANELVTHVDPSNQLMVTASREHLLAVRDALAQMDVPGPEAPGLGLQVLALEKRLADLEQRLTALETKKAGG